MAGTYGEAGWTYGQLAVTYGGGDVVVPPTIITGSTADTDDLLSLTNGVRQRVDCYRFDIVDANGNVLGEVHPIRTDNPALVDNETTRTEFRSLSNFEVDTNERDAVNPLTDRVRPVMVLQNGAEFPLGVFMFSDASYPQRSWGTQLSATLSDQLFLLDQPVGRNVGFSQGTNIVNAAVAIAGEVITGPIVPTPSTAKLSTPLAWKLDQTRLKIITDLMTLLSYYPPYFDNMGQLILRPVVAPPFSPTVPPYEADTRIIQDSVLYSDDLLRAANRYVVYDTGAQSSAVIGTYDIPTTAPNSFAVRGFYIVKPIGIQGVVTSAGAVQIAASQYHTDPDQFRSVEFKSTGDPRHDTFEIVQFLGDTYIETAWDMELRAGGPMKHKLRKLYDGTETADPFQPPGVPGRVPVSP